MRLFDSVLMRVQNPKKPPLNFSQFVARQIERRRGLFPLRCRAHRLQRRRPLRGLLVSMATIFDLLQMSLSRLNHW